MENKNMRGQGQTKNLVYNLPNERCMVITYDKTSGRYIEELIKDLRGKDFAKKIKVICISSVEDLSKLLGYSHLIFFDHSFYDNAQEDLIVKTLNHAESASIVYHNHKGSFK